MNWFKQHLNLTYVIMIVISMLILIPNVVTMDIEEKGAVVFIGPVISFIINILAGIWILRQKKQSMWFIAIMFIFYLAFFVLALALPNNRSGQAEVKKISDAEYYKDRSK
jgi:hypothetical protein